MSAPTKTAPANSQPKAAPPRELHEGEALLEKALEEATGRLETCASRYVEEIESAESRLRKTILTARGIEDLRALLTGDVMKLIMRVQNQRLGFLTDKPPKGDSAGGYHENVVRDCVIEGLLKGVYPYGNEMNIIGGNLMIVQNGWRRKLHELPGLDEFPSIEPGDVAETPKYYKVPCVATWTYRGQRGTLSRNIFVARDTTQRTNQYGKTYSKDDFTTIDNLMGKIERKMLEAVFKKIRGEVFGALDEDGEDAEPVTAEQVLGPSPKAEDKPAAPPASKPATAESADAMAERKALEARCTAAYKVAFDAGKITDQGFKNVLEGTYGVKSRVQMNAAQLAKLADYLEGLMREREPGDDGDEPSGQIFPDEAPEAHADKR